MWTLEKINNSHPFLSFMMSRPQEAGDVQTEVSIETGEGTEKSGKKPGFVRRHIWGLTAATTATLGALGILSRPSDGKNHAFAQIDNAMLQLPSTNRITTAVRDTYIVGKSLFGVLPAPTPQQVAAQTKVHIIERLANRLAVPGHVGKKHKIIASHASGKYGKNMQTIMDALKIIAEKKKTNPVQILVKAIENGSPRDEITTIEYGGARYPQAVDVSPLRRVNLAIRWMVQGMGTIQIGEKSQ
jgi:ribosomal protein S7